MKVLVTGCNGFIGKYVCDRLKKAGYMVYGLGKEDVPQIRLDEYYSVDISYQTGMEICAKALGKIDALVHCAAYICYDNTDSRIMQINAVGTQNVVSMANYTGVDKLVYCSSVPVIGVPVDLPITEKHPLAPRTMYHVSKLAGEYIASTADGTAIILRIPSPIGAGMNPSTILPVFVSRCLEDEPIYLRGTGSRVQNYISVLDIADAIFLSLTKNVSGCLNLSGDAISNLELAKLCKKVLSSNSKILFSGEEDPADGQIWDVSGARAAQALGFRPQVSLEETIRAVAEQLSVRREI